MQHGYAADTKGAEELLNQRLWLGDKGGDPTTPGDIGVGAFHRLIHQVTFDDLYPGCFTTLDCMSREINKVRRSLQGDHGAARAHDIGSIHCRVARTRTEVDDLRAPGHPGPTPGVQYVRAPDLMLQSQAIDLSLVGP